MKRFRSLKEEIMPISQDAGSVLNEGMIFKDGNLSGIGKITINCYFSGNISTNDLVIVEEAAGILGNIEAQSIIIKGNIKGDVEVVESAQIRTGGVLNGNITCATLEIAVGAAFSGQCNMTSSTKESNILSHMIGKSDESQNEPPALVHKNDKKQK